jgi:hypothetical protein
MNAARRKEIDKALELLGQAQAIIGEVASEERDSYEGLQASERGQRMDEVAGMLEEADSTFEDLVGQLEDCKE